ncbi:MAG: 23S rRNA (adenine(2503)-C(2))-methyltransferase RlmN [Candidatus Margulisiibacteriota bacterium]
MKPHLLSFNREELRNWVQEQGLKPFIADQLLNWVYKRYVLDFEQMTNLAKPLRATLAEALDTLVFTKVEKLVSKDGLAVKYIHTLTDNSYIEMVVLKEKSYNTLCISSQCGCPVDCKFCLTGVSGFKRNLEVQEIIGQLHRSFADGYPISNIVFMGMGEPLLNYDNVFKAIEIITSPDGFGISKRKITVSTAGYLQGIKRLIKDQQFINLAFSVGNADPIKRAALMPIENRNPLMEVVKTIKQYQDMHNRKLTLEYTLLEGKNDSDQDLKGLVGLSKYLNAKINLINLNPHSRIPFKPVSSAVLTAFKEKIHAMGAPVTIRFRKGQDISAACGQLGESRLG